MLGMTGSVAALKVLDLIEKLREGIAFRVVMTRAARQFVDPDELASLTGEPVLTRLLFDRDRPVFPHIELARWAEVFVLAPATAGSLGRLASGGGTNALTTVAISISPTEKPCLIAPAMSAIMWEHPIVKASVETLRLAGYRFVGPDEGRQACGSTGFGRLAKGERLADAVLSSLEEACREGAEEGQP